MALIDWIIIVVFLIGMTTIGFLFTKKNKNIEDYFLGGRAMPTWLVVFSSVGASISAGTFVGAPQIAYDGNMTYVMLSVGAILGGLLSSVIILPTLYKSKTITIYGYLGDRFGSTAKGATSVMFLIGQLLTAGSRLFIAAIAVSVMLYNDIYMSNLIISVLILGVISTLYTMAGGIKGLIYIDTIQILLVIGTGLLSIYLLYHLIPASFHDIVNALNHAPTEGGGEMNKLQLIDPKLTFKEPYNLIGALVGCTVFKFAQYSTDHEFVQRQLTCQSVEKASKSLVMSQLVSLPVVIIFMIIGLLLYNYYSCPELMGAKVPFDTLADSRQVFPQFIFNHIPTGIKGLMMVGLLAAALSSFNSAINAMTGSFVSDIYIPLKEKLSKKNQVKENHMKESRIMVLIMGLVLTSFAIFAAFMQQAGGLSLVDFALGIMSFSYAGMLGVFLCAILTKRGNVRSVISSLIVGALVVFVLQPNIMNDWSAAIFGHEMKLAWPWWSVVGGTISFIVCVLGKPKKQDGKL